MMVILTLADIIWTGLMMSSRSLWIIGAGIMVEWIFVYFICDVSLKKALIVNIAMNAASCVMGLFLIPVLGIVWELSLVQTVIYHFFHAGTFSYPVWIMTVLLAALTNNFLEYYILGRFLVIRNTATGFGWLYVANVISVSVAVISLIITPIS